MEGTRLTGLWKSTTKDGKTYLSGNLSGSARLLVFPNDYKKESKDPDFYVWLAPKAKKDAPESSAAAPPADPFEG